MSQPERFSPPPAELAEILSPGRTAVLVIDIQNDFVHPEGVSGRGMNRPVVEAAVDAAEKLVGAARSVGAPVIFIRLETTKELDSRSNGLRRQRQGKPYVESGRVCRAGTWGADWYRLTPLPGEINVPKPRYSSFQDTTLDLQLKALGVDTLVVCGVATECCVEAGVRDAHHRDYNVFVVEDACASSDLDLHASAIRTMSLYCALIVGADDVTQAWSSLEPIALAARA